MAFSIATLARIAFGPPPDLVCSETVWDTGVIELCRRTHGRRESGAFLLGQKGKRRTIEEFVYYDDIDPDALRHGIVEHDGRRLGALWAHCRASERSVVADIHVHPRGYGQSATDRANPMIAELGHMAIILPNFARGSNLPGEIGVYEYLGNKQWRDCSSRVPTSLHLGWWPKWR